MTARRRSRPIPWSRFGASLVLAAGVLACLGAWVAGTPLPYFDYDDATQGIFVNDLSFRHSLDASFAGRPDRQDLYRTAFAAQRLPFSLPLSWIERGLGWRPWDAEKLLRAAALLLGLAGAWLAAKTLSPRRAEFAADRWALIAATLAHPSLAILGRTGASFYVFAFALFWLGMLAASRRIEGGRAAWIYGAGLVAALCLLNPYPPLFAWPLAVLLLAATSGRLRAFLRDRHAYGAAAVGLLVAALATAGMAAAYETSLPAFLGRLAAFRADRGHAVSAAQLVVSPIDKIVKLADQQLLLRADRLGDVSRVDSVWTLGAVQPAVWIWAALAVVGIAAALRERSGTDRVAMAAAAGLLSLFFTVSFPEGRFALPLLPCWAFLALRGVRVALPGETARRAALGALLLLLAAGTEWRLRETYVPSIRDIAAGSEGMREAAPLIAALPGGGRGARVGMPYAHRFETELYFRMVMPEGTDWRPRPEFARIADAPGDGSGEIALSYADDTDWLLFLDARGFLRRASLRGGATGREIAMLWRPPRPPRDGTP